MSEKRKALFSGQAEQGSGTNLHHKILCFCGYYTAGERKKQDVKAATVNATAK